MIIFNSVHLMEIQAFLAFCEECEVDIHLYFEKASNLTFYPFFSMLHFNFVYASSLDAMSSFDASVHNWF